MLPGELDLQFLILHAESLEFSQTQDRCVCVLKCLFFSWTDENPQCFSSHMVGLRTGTCLRFYPITFICFLLHRITVHLTPAFFSQTETRLQWRSINLLSLLLSSTFNTFCSHSGPLSASRPHTEVTVLTFAESACLNRLFRSCILGDFGLGMRGERLFSAAALAVVLEELETGGGCFASWQHSL